MRRTLPSERLDHLTCLSCQEELPTVHGWTRCGVLPPEKSSCHCRASGLPDPQKWLCRNWLGRRDLLPNLLCARLGKGSCPPRLVESLCHEAVNQARGFTSQAKLSVGQVTLGGGRLQSPGQWFYHLIFYSTGSISSQCKHSGTIRICAGGGRAGRQADLRGLQGCSEGRSGARAPASLVGPQISTREIAGEDPRNRTAGIRAVQPRDEVPPPLQASRPPAQRCPCTSQVWLSSTPSVGLSALALTGGGVG